MRSASIALLALVCAGPVAAQGTGRFEKELAAFAEMDAKIPPPKGQVLFVGSSTMVDWDAAKYFPDLRVVNRALWGSALADTARNVERLILPYEPRLVVVYGGDNDVDAGLTSEQVAAEFERLARTVHARLPLTRIAFIGIKPSPQRWLTIDRMRAANAIIRAICSRDDRLAFVDVDGPMLGWDEKPRPDLFKADGLHLSEQGYQLWTTLLRPLMTP